jgi:hypothetical protein
MPQTANSTAHGAQIRMTKSFMTLLSSKDANSFAPMTTMGSLMGVCAPLALFKKVNRPDRPIGSEMTDEEISTFVQEVILGTSGTFIWPDGAWETVPIA